MPRGDCEGVGGTTRQPCCRRRGGGGGALVEPAALAALLSAGGYGYDLRRTIMAVSYTHLDVYKRQLLASMLTVRDSVGNTVTGDVWYGMFPVV